MEHAETAPTAGRVAVAIPAYNEAEGIGEFLLEIDAALSPVASSLVFVLIDDMSTDNTLEVLESVRPQLKGELLVHQTGVNSGQGPAMLEGYRRALDTAPEYVLAVDGDGQFLGTDLRRVLVLLRDAADGVCGVRRFRYDPWFRMTMTRVLRVYINSFFGVPTRDANCPLRGFRAKLLDELLQWVPDGALIPNVELAILAARRGATLVEVDVNHRVRRGSTAAGTMWTGKGQLSVMKRLIVFSGRALRESWSFHGSVNSGMRPPVSSRRGG